MPCAPPAIPFSLGSFRYRGVCPPSKPGRVPLPDLAFCPRMPNPQVPPCPQNQGISAVVPSPLVHHAREVLR